MICQGARGETGVGNLTYRLRSETDYDVLGRRHANCLQQHSALEHLITITTRRSGGGQIAVRASPCHMSLDQPC